MQAPGSLMPAVGVGGLIIGAKKKIMCYTTWKYILKHMVTGNC